MFNIHILAVIGLSILIIRSIFITYKELEKKNIHERQEEFPLYLQLIGSILVGIYSYYSKIWALFILNCIGILQSIIFLYHIYNVTSL